MALEVLRSIRSDGTIFSFTQYASHTLHGGGCRRRAVARATAGPWVNMARGRALGVRSSVHSHQARSRSMLRIRSTGAAVADVQSHAPRLGRGRFFTRGNSFHSCVGSPPFTLFRVVGAAKVFRHFEPKKPVPIPARSWSMLFLKCLAADVQSHAPRLGPWATSVHDSSFHSRLHGGGYRRRAVARATAGPWANRVQRTPATNAKPQA